jgi:hypothetical protein
MIYEEIKDNVGYFVKLYKLSKVNGLSVKEVADLLAITNNDLSAIEERFKRLRNDIDSTL